MKTFFLFLLSIVAGTSIFSQSPINEKPAFKIKGHIVDSATHRPLEYATISLYSPVKKDPVSGTVTDSRGNFIIENISAGIYTMEVEFIGYKTFTLSQLEIDNNHVLTDVKQIVLAAKAGTLQTVTVNAQGKIIENKIDKLVFNAERDITSQTGVATDILKKVPQVSVDIDGNVELAGSSSIRFLINGKPSTAFGSNISDVLQSIPASQVKSIEVITNPGAKYDAEGLGGIINIILKTNNAEGFNGNLSVTAGTRAENGSFNFNARKGKFGMNAFVSGNMRLRAGVKSASDRQTNDTAAKTIIMLHQDGLNRSRRGGFQSGIGFDWDLNDRNNFSGSLTYNNFYNATVSSANQYQYITDGSINGNIISQFNSIINANNSFHINNFDASVNYKRTFAKEDQELEISATTSFENNQSDNNNYQLLLPQNSVFYGTMSKNPGKEKDTEIEIDYTLPFKKDVILGIGGKLLFYDISSTSQVLRLDPASNNYIVDNFLSNNLTYHQDVYAIYSEMSFPVSTLFNTKIGGRYERTEISSFYSNAQQRVKVPGYNTFVPSIYFSRKLGESSLLKLSFSKRIERPDYGDLNPFINTNDPKNLSTGNPDLLPETGRRYELGYSTDIKKAGSLMVSLFYRINENDIQPFIVFYPSYAVGDTTYTNVAVSKRENIGRENNTGINFFLDLRFIPKLNLRSNLFFFHRHTINAIDEGYNSNSFNYRLNLNASYQFTSTLATEFFGNFNSARHEAQGRYPSFTTYSFAVRKQFWNKKGSIALTATNPFKGYIDQRTSVFGPNFRINGLRSIPFRSIGINFTWKFGKLEFKKEAEKESDALTPPAEGS